jgi:hypothetical protein
MTYNHARVAQIWVAATGKRGTGFLLCNGYLLTAYHVVQGCGDRDIEFRLQPDYRERRDRWITATLLRENKRFDVALLQFNKQPDMAVAFPGIEGALVLDEPINCEAGGFPAFRQDYNQGQSVYRYNLVEGWIKPVPLEIRDKLGELRIEIKGATPSGIKSWQGISGAAVFANAGYLAGVVIQGPEELAGQLLEAVAIETVLNTDPEFKTDIERIRLGSEQDHLIRQQEEVKQKLVELETCANNSAIGASEAQGLVVSREPESLTEIDFKDLRSVHLVIAVFWQDQHQQIVFVQPKLCYRNQETGKIDACPFARISARDCAKKLQDFPELLEMLVDETFNYEWERLIPASNQLPLELTIEIFLPLELLACPMSQWCGKDSEVLLDYPIVLGCSDRFQETRRRLHNQMLKGWQNFQAAIQKDSNLTTIDWLNSDLAQTESFRDYLGFQCFGTWLKSGEKHLQNWEEFVKSGMTIALWMCEGKLQRPQIATTYQTLINCSYYEFLDQIPTLRDRQRKTCEDCLGVFYENPNYVPEMPNQFFWPGT